MSDRIYEIQEYIDRLVDDLGLSANHYFDFDDIKIHLSGVSSCCVLLASRRGLDTEIAAVSGLLHDIYRYKTGIHAFHAHNGAEMARVVLKYMKNQFSDNEKQIILSAIFHHGDKNDIHGDYEELLKDADTLSPFLFEGGAKHASSLHLRKKRLKRLKKMEEELNLTFGFDYPDFEKQKKFKSYYGGSQDKRTNAADIAERLAAASITGNRQDRNYMNMIRHWPEDSAPDELKNGWCAAFVYHCFYEAGIILPIRWLSESHRFAGVSQWFSWGNKLGYFIKDEPGVIPERGDIIIYKNSIPPENKPEDQRDIPTDHIGIILSCDGKNFTVAEGNVNNENVSGILTKPLHKNTEGYIRIDNSFNYKDWKFDYMTGTERLK